METNLIKQKNNIQRSSLKRPADLLDLELMSSSKPGHEKRTQNSDGGRTNRCVLDPGVPGGEMRSALVLNLPCSTGSLCFLRAHKQCTLTPELWGRWIRCVSFNFNTCCVTSSKLILSHWFF